VRSSGPALVPFNVSNVLADPKLQLFGSAPGSAPIATNAGWKGDATISAAATAVGAFTWTSGASGDSALVDSLSQGAYTAETLGASGDTGVALAEVYDATPAGTLTALSPRLTNISARVSVGTGGGVLIAGFVVGGTTSETVLIRASGPALVPFNVSGTLADPQLQLFGGAPGSAPIATNSGWAGDTQVAAVASAVGAFSWSDPASKDSALLVTLPPGAYTAVVSGASGDTGVALVEVYEVH